MQIGSETSEGFRDLRAGISEDRKRVLLNLSVVRQSGHNRQLGDFTQLLRGFQSIEKQHTQECDGKCDNRAKNKIVANRPALVGTDDAVCSGDFDNRCLWCDARSSDHILGTCFE